MWRRTAVLSALMLLLTISAFAYDMGDVPQWNMGDRILACSPPEGTDVPEVGQWPEAAWLEINDIQFVIYTKHLAAVNPETKQAKFMVWISVPLQYKRAIEQDHEFGPGDANAYLRTAGISSMTPELYKGPGDTWMTAPGAHKWDSRTDKCVLGVFTPGVGEVAPKAFALHRIKFEGRGSPLRLGLMKCRCPSYQRGNVRNPGEEWIAWEHKSNQKFKVDQWGLPGNSPVPPEFATPVPATPIVTIGPFVQGGMWGPYDMGDVPEYEYSYLVNGTVPPEGSVPETRQWPAATWFDVHGAALPIVMYCKHLSGYDPATESGKWMVWIGPHWDYVYAVEQDHPYGPADAAEYLKRAGIKNVTATTGQYDNEPEYQEWNAGTDRCVLGVLEPKRGAGDGWRVGTNVELLDGRRAPLYRGTLHCSCADYPNPPEHTEWGRVRRQGHEGATIYVVDQWGLPGCSPVPAPVAAVGPVTPGVLSPFVGAWIDVRGSTLTAIYPDGTWAMRSLLPESEGIRVGNWGASAGMLMMRTHLANVAQLWLQRNRADARADLLIRGPFDLSMAWDLRLEDGVLVGMLRKWDATFNPGGAMQDFIPWDDVANEPLPVTWIPALQVYAPVAGPGGIQVAPPELIELIEEMETGGRTGGKDLGVEFTHQTQ